MLIRHFEQKDIGAIREILDVIGWAEQYLARQLQCLKTLYHHDCGEIQIAVKDDCVVGFVQAEHHHWNQLTYVYGLVVHPNFRKMGVARKLMTSLENATRSRGFRGIYLDTPVSNMDARAFYASIGFSEAYVMPEFYESGLDGVAFQRFFEKNNVY